MKSKRAAVYVRISTADQNQDLQRHELPEYCAEYSDIASF